MFPQILAGLFAAGALVSGPVLASADEALQGFADDIHTFSAQYEQTQLDEHGDLIQQSSGSMALSRPGKFRWSYETPYEQLMVCDGQTIWFYDPDLAQVTRRPAAVALEGTPAALLSQRASLGASYEIEDGGQEQGFDLVRLTPKADGGDFKSIELWLMNNAPVRMRFHDTLGGQTDIRFSQIKINPQLESSLFRFEPPEGVEVVEAG